MFRNLRALMTTPLVLATLLCVCLCTATSPARAADPIELVLRDLNKTKSVVGTQEIKSFPIVFSAYLKLSPPPMEIGEEFNHTTIHPGMSAWDLVSGWAESNPDMAKALLECEGKTLFGLPYGRGEVEKKFSDADLVADIGANGTLRDNRFPYLHAIDTVTAFAAAEAYRLLEAGKVQEALDLTIAVIFLCRQCCDREFHEEALYSITLLTEALVNLRDMFYKYQDEISVEQFGVIAMEKLPYLRPDRSRLLIPEGDRRVSTALIKEVFDSRGQADPEKFASTFARIQSRDEPLTRWGAAKRWAKVAEVHDSEEASQERLTLVYDDWWRRWRIEAYDPILDITTQFERTNPIRYAAVLYSMQNIEQLFGARNMLLASVHGTEMAAGLCGYRADFGTYPDDSDKLYSQFVRKRSDRDPFDTGFMAFKYRVIDSQFAIDAFGERIFLERGDAILYSKGEDNDDDRGAVHTITGEAGDIVVWPPIRARLREEGLIE